MSVRFPPPLLPTTAASTAAAIQAAAPLLTPKKISSKEVNLAGRIPLQRKNSVPVNQSPTRDFPGSAKYNFATIVRDTTILYTRIFENDESF